jgi:hypothetical protein
LQGIQLYSPNKALDNNGNDDNSFERTKKPSQEFPFVALKEIATANPKSLELKQGATPARVNMQEKP